MKFIVALKDRCTPLKQVNVEADRIDIANGFVQFVDDAGPVAAFNADEVIGWERESMPKSIFETPQLQK